MFGRRLYGAVARDRRWRAARSEPVSPSRGSSGHLGYLRRCSDLRVYQRIPLLTGSHSFVTFPVVHRANPDDARGTSSPTDAVRGQRGRLARKTTVVSSAVAGLPV